MALNWISWLWYSGKQAVQFTSRVVLPLCSFIASHLGVLHAPSRSLSIQNCALKSHSPIDTTNFNLLNYVPDRRRLQVPVLIMAKTEEAILPLGSLELRRSVGMRSHDIRETSPTNPAMRKLFVQRWYNQAAYVTCGEQRKVM